MCCKNALQRTNFEIFVCNYGEKEKTKVAVSNYYLDGCNTIHYKRFEKIDGDPVVHIQKYFYKQEKQFAYYWVCNDLLCPDIVKADKFISQAYEENVDCLLVNTFYALSEEMSAEDDFTVYKGQADLLAENIDKAVATGGILVSANLAECMLREYTESKNVPFWQINALAVTFEKHEIRCVASDKWLFLYNERPAYFCVSDFDRNTLITWTKDWYGTISDLPETYSKHQLDMLSMDAKEYTPLFLMNLIYWRADGTYNLKIYNQMKPYITHVTHKSMKAMTLIALAPKWLSEWIIKHINSRMIRGCIAFYRVCVLKKEE